MSTLNSLQESLKHKTGDPSSSTANLTPTPKGQPSEVNIERVPIEDNSMIVLEASAGNGLSFKIPTWVVGHETVETEHFRANFRNGICLQGMNWGLAMGLKGIKGGRKWSVRDCV